jgi:hypothetical protein
MGHQLYIFNVDWIFVYSNSMYKNNAMTNKLPKKNIKGKKAKLVIVYLWFTLFTIRFLWYQNELKDY